MFPLWELSVSSGKQAYGEPFTKKTDFLRQLRLVLEVQERKTIIGGVMSVINIPYRDLGSRGAGGASAPPGLKQ